MAHRTSIVTVGSTPSRVVQVNKQGINDAFFVLLQKMNPSVDEYAQRYNLKWTNHSNNILLMFSEQLLKERLVDVTLSCEGQFVKAHKMVLSACSPYFQELFRVHTVDHPLIIMNGVKFSILQQMIQFMYQGEIKVGDEDLDDLLTISENMQIKGLCKIRREKATSDTNTLMADIVTMQSASLPKNTPKGRKRRKLSQSRSPIQGSSTESHVNGESSSNQISDDVPDKTSRLNEVFNNDRDESDRGAKMSKLTTIPAKQVPHLIGTLTPTSQEAIYDDKTMDKQGSKIPRPPNAFMIFANEWRKKLAIEHQGESNKEISVRLGNMWKSLPVPTKDLYYAAARKADEDHKVRYPGPKEARLRKEMRGNSSQRASIINDIDASSLVRLVMEHSARTSNSSSSNEENPLLNRIKEEPEEYDIFTEDNAHNENSNSSADNLLTVSSTQA